MKIDLKILKIYMKCKNIKIHIQKEKKGGDGGGGNTKASLALKTLHNK